MQISISLGISPTSAVTVIGSAQVGAVLSLSPVTMTGASPVQFLVQWLRDGADISGATSASYTVVTADAGHVISAEVTLPDTSVLTTTNTVNIEAGSAPAPIGKAAVLYSVDPEATWAPISQGVRLPTGNNDPAGARWTGYYTLPSANPGVWGATNSFLLWAGRIPNDAIRGNKACAIFGTTGANLSISAYGTGHATKPNKLEATFSATGLTPSSGTLSLTRRETVPNVLLALVRDAGASNAFTFYMISLVDGTLLESASVSGGVTGTRSNTTSMGIGILGNAAATSADTMQGDVQFVISGRGVAPSLANLQSIALGASPNTVLTGLGSVTYDFYYDFAGYGLNPPASLSAPAGITTTVAAATRRGADFFPATTSRRQSTSQYLVPTMAWRHGEIIGIKPGQTSVTLSVSCVASAGVAPQFRYCREDGAVLIDWTTMTSVGGGAFTGSAPCGWNGDGKYGVMEFRDSLAPNNSNTRAIWTDYFAIGPKVICAGQSELQNNWYSATNLGDTLDAGARGMITLATRPTVSGANIYCINAPGKFTLSDGLAATMNALVDLGVCPALLGMDAVGATSASQSLGGIMPARPYSHFVANRDLVGATGTTILYHWGVSDVAEIATYKGLFFDAVWFGTGAAIGATAQLPSVLATQNFSVLYSDPAMIFMPLGRKRSGSTGPLTTPQIPNYAVGRKAGDDWATAQGFVVGPYINDMALVDQFHQLATSPNGNRLTGYRIAQSIARAYGMYPMDDPTIASIALTAPNEYTVSFSLPNGGTLYSPAPTALTGWMVNSSNAGFTAAISGQNVKLTKSSGNWAGTEVIKYEHDAPRDLGTSADEATTVAGCLYETTPYDAAGLGLPVKPYGV